MNEIKARIYNLIREDDVNGFWGKVFDGALIALISTNVLLVVLDTFELPAALSDALGYFEIVSVIVFSVEYILRFWVSDLARPQEGKLEAHFKHAISLMAIVDFLAILPFYIPFVISIDLRVLRMFRLLRLFRLLKFHRYTEAISNISKVMKNKSEQLVSSIFVVMILMVISSVLMYNVEHEIQPDVFRNAFSGFWWTLNTITTVGYGDIYPVTTAGRILSGFISILGIGLVAVPTGIISAGFIEAADERSGR